MQMICVSAFQRFTPGKTVTDIFSGPTCIFFLFIKGSPCFVCI